MDEVVESQYERQVREAAQGLVRCDSFCGAREEPETLAEHRDTLEHYKYHSLLSGCSHAC